MNIFKIEDAKWHIRHIKKKCLPFAEGEACCGARRGGYVVVLEGEVS